MEFDVEPVSQKEQFPCSENFSAWIAWGNEYLKSFIQEGPFQSNQEYPESPLLTDFDPNIKPLSIKTTGRTWAMDPSILRRFMNLNLLQRNLEDLGSQESSGEDSPKNSRSES